MANTRIYKLHALVPVSSMHMYLGPLLCSSGLHHLLDANGFLIEASSSTDLLNASRRQPSRQPKKKNDFTADTRSWQRRRLAIINFDHARAVIGWPYRAPCANSQPGAPTVCPFRQQQTSHPDPRCGLLGSSLPDFRAPARVVPSPPAQGPQGDHACMYGSCDLLSLAIWANY